MPSRIGHEGRSGTGRGLGCSRERDLAVGLSTLKWFHSDWYAIFRSGRLRLHWTSGWKSASFRSRERMLPARQEKQQVIRGETPGRTCHEFGNTLVFTSNCERNMPLAGM